VKPQQQGPVLAKVNGVSIKRAEAMDRAWKEYGTAVLNEMADEILVKQAAESLKIAVDPAVVDARLKRVQGQFKDEAAFQASLTGRGVTVADLRAQISTQVLRENLVIKAKALSATEDEAKQFFAANKEKLGATDALRLRAVVVGGEKEAVDFLAAIRAGADFAKMASQVSLDADSKANGGDLGFVTKGRLPAETEKQVFALKPGEVSGAIKSGAGYQIFKAEEFRAGKAAVYEEVGADLLRAILADKVTKAWPAYLDELRSKAKYEAGR
jgi:parvulin-like peptidyl-prolyl isomerase